MNDCKKFSQFCAEALYEDLDAQHKQWFNEHKSSCSTCNLLFVKMKSTLSLMDNVEKPEPEPEFWHNYWDNLEGLLGDVRQSKTVKMGWWQKIPQWFEIRPKLTLQLAGGLAFLLIGILIGKMVFTIDIPLESIRSNQSESYITFADKVILNQRAGRYLQRSKILLLGLVNLDESEGEPIAINFTHQRQISQQLIQETSSLKNDLDRSDQMLLRELISDLEIVLLQIANLEADNDISAVELVKSAANSQSILLRINLEEMREASKIERIQAPSSKSKKGQTI